mmetsp:Transcript_9872/g.22083  ORF Transcript_9872/g.22083 Transcript_9872/m.22083 type:complete len:873 (+) Transcript_9872:91-2709(+)|eukprot:CAMPEP_0178409274 /NCGR_PEP_ID=MMETSP0689_2-20121128/20378_1 /TAXON_ID=160604 /ORGANISM="Amphidinium massartii, Strain CS-259" /LENGTH=872 /DNA_ID=CAMNT_0020030411 /DNA_START=3 /DNA_END=2621 /DNA_ORIENTATION=+
MSTSVQVTITGARNLPKADWFGHSDLYLVCSVQPQPQVHGQTKVARTALENNVLNPVWNETLVLQPYNQGDTLEFKVMDKETLRSIELGKAILQWPDATRRGFKGALPIQMASPPSNTVGQPMLDVAVSVDVPASAAPPPTAQAPADPVQTATTSPPQTATSAPYAETSYPPTAQTLPPTAQQPPPIQTIPPETQTTTTYTTAPPTQADPYYQAQPQPPPQQQAPPPQQVQTVIPTQQPPPSYYSQQPQSLPPTAGEAMAPAGPMRLKLSMISGRNLPDTGWMSTKDPFCMCHIPGRPHTDCQTPVCKNTLNPLWNSEHEILDFHPGDVLEFVVFNKQAWPMNDERLGVARLPLDPTRGHDGFIPLVDETNTRANAAVNVRAMVLGGLPPSQPCPPPQSPGEACAAPPSAENARIGVNIAGARNLRVDPSRSEVFCTCQAIGKPHTEVKSVAVRGSANPIFNLSQEMPGYAAGDTLEVAVWDQADGAPRNVGGATLPGSYILPSGWHGDLPIYEKVPVGSSAAPTSVGMLQANIGPVQQAPPVAIPPPTSPAQQTSFYQQQQCCPPPSQPFPPTAQSFHTTQSFSSQAPPTPQPTSMPPGPTYQASPPRYYQAPPMPPAPAPYGYHHPPFAQPYSMPAPGCMSQTFVQGVVPPPVCQGPPPMVPHAAGFAPFPPLQGAPYGVVPQGMMVQQCGPAGPPSPARSDVLAVSSGQRNARVNGYHTYRSEMEQRREIKDAFDTFDTNRSGYVDYYSLKCAMRALGFPVRKAEVLEAMREEGCMETGKISYDEFSRILSRKYTEREPLDDILRVFRFFDKDGKGRISLADLRKVVAELGEGLSESDLQCMIDEFDENRDGCINESEFVKVMQSAAMH